MNTCSLQFTTAWFPDDGSQTQRPAFGDQQRINWFDFLLITDGRREGEKNGRAFVPARFKLEPDGRVRRQRANVVARTLIVLDVETSKATGEVPPDPIDLAKHLKDRGSASLVYTSHSHSPNNIRYRVVCPLDREVSPDLPAVEILALALGLDGVIDPSKRTPASIFYLSSCPPGATEGHHNVAVKGSAVRAAWIEAESAIRQAEADRIAAEAHAEAAQRLADRIAAGFNPDDTLIEKLRSRFDLHSVLRSHGYEKAGSKYRHPNSQSGSFGADVKAIGGIARAFSHNGTDPLHSDNLPAWCTVKAVDALDATIILDFAGDRTRALRELAQRFGLTKAAEKKAVARVILRLIREQASQQQIETEAFAEGERQGLTRDEVRSVALWACQQAARRAA